MQDQIKPIVTGSYNSEVAIETVIDGITVKAVAYRTIRSHWVEILEPFKVMGAGNGNIPIFAIESYQKHLKTIDLYEDSLNLVRYVYRQHKALYDPEAPEHEQYRIFRPKLFAAREALEKTTGELRAIKKESKRKFKAAEIDERTYAAILKELGTKQYLAKEAVEDLEKKIISENFPDYRCCTQLLETLETVYQRKYPDQAPEDTR